MEEVSQKSNEIRGSKFFGFSNLLVITVLFFIIGALISGVVVFWLQKQMLKAAAEEIRQCIELKADYDKTKIELKADYDKTELDTFKSGINWKDKLLLTEDYGRFKIGAYDISDLLGDVFIVAPIDNGQPATYYDAYALSFASNAFMMDNLFDIVGEKIYVLNQNKGFIDIYKASFTDKTLATSAYYRMDYIDSINGPKYEVGVPYSIKCQNNSCQIMTAFHQQSGCNMELNLETKQYTGIECSSMAYP